MRYDPFLHDGRERDRSELGADAPVARVEVVERLFLDDGRDLCAPAHARDGLMGDDGAVRLLHGGDESVLVERLQRPRVEDLAGDPLLSGLLGRLERLVDEAAEQAAEEGISVEVFDPRTLQPLDEDALIASVKKTNRAVVAHEAVTRMGWGAEVAAVIQEKAFDYLDAPVARVGAKFTPIPFAPVMEEWVIPHAKDVLAAIKKTVGKE